jgi:hypothetical protein
MEGLERSFELSLACTAVPNSGLYSGFGFVFQVGPASVSALTLQPALCSTARFDASVACFASQGPAMYCLLALSELFTRAATP